MAIAKRLRLAQPQTQPDIRTLHPEDVAGLRLNRQSSIDDALAALSALPGHSVWCPESLEYVLVTPWRHRQEIGYLSELASIRSTEALILAAAERGHAHGDALTLMIDLDEERPAGFYRRAGLQPIERIVTYELRRGNQRLPDSGGLTFVRGDMRHPDHLSALLELDHAAFPWLWWNSPREFERYHEQPGVEIYIGVEGSRVVSYSGFTLFHGWAHLDRIAVLPGVQQRGLGRATLAFAVRELLARGVDRIGLSTQENNTRSRTLYEGFGFRRSPGYDYCLYGTAHREPALSLMASTATH
jgi:ribosomal protein S18 acetylase RimI-like enzyme